MLFPDYFLLRMLVPHSIHSIFYTTKNVKCYHSELRNRSACYYSSANPFFQSNVPSNDSFYSFNNNQTNDNSPSECIRAVFKWQMSMRTMIHIIYIVHCIHQH